jgi:hypothetical protein
LMAVAFIALSAHQYIYNGRSTHNSTVCYKYSSTSCTMHDVMYGMMVTVKSRIVNLVVDLDSDGSNGIMFKEAHEMLK